MHEKLKNQITENVQSFYDKSGIAEKAKCTIETLGNNKMTVKLHTRSLLGYDCLRRVNAIIWSLMPSGLYHEIVNVVFDSILISEDAIYGGVKDEKKIDDANTSVTMAGVNEAGEIVPLPVQPKKKR
jgi:hypothetical protein